MLKGPEALALGLSSAGLKVAWSSPQSPLYRVQLLLSRSGAEDCHRRALSDGLAVNLALGGALLARHPTCALVSHLGLGGVMDVLSTAGVLNEYRSGAVLIEGPDPGPRWAPGAADNRAALAGTASLPILEPGTADELYHLVRLAFRGSEAGGLPVVVRACPRALADRADVRQGSPFAELEPAGVPQQGAVLFRGDGPYLCTAATYRYHAERRQLRLRALSAVAAALTARGAGQPAPAGAPRRGVVLAGHMGLRAQVQASARGLATLRLGMAWPLPEPALLSFLSELQEVLVLEEGEPFLLPQLQALAYRAGLSVRIAGTEAAAERRPVYYDDAQIDAALSRFAAQQKGKAGPVEVAERGLPGYDLQGAQRLIEQQLLPRPDQRGEVGEEPWPLFFHRVRGTMPALHSLDPRLPLLKLLRQLPRPTLIAAGADPPGVVSGLQQLCDVQLGAGSAAPMAAALSVASAVVGTVPEAGSAGSVEGRPLAVALIDGSGGQRSHFQEMLGLLDNAAAGRDVLHVLILAREGEVEEAGPGRQGELLSGGHGALLAQLRAAGIEVVLSDLEDPAGLARALSYVANLRGPRALACLSAPVEPDSRLSG